MEAAVAEGATIVRIGTALFGLLFLVWSSQAELEQVTRAPGKVIALSRTQSVQAPDGGVVREILAREGESVTRNQLLVRLDDAKARAALTETQGRAAALRAALARLRAGAGLAGGRAGDAPTATSPCSTTAKEEAKPTNPSPRVNSH